MTNQIDSGLEVIKRVINAYKVCGRRCCPRFLNNRVHIKLIIKLLPFELPDAESAPYGL